MWRKANGYDRVRRVGNRRRGTNGDPDREWPDTTHPAVRCGDPERRLSAQGAIRQAAGRGVAANGQLIAMRFPNRAPQSPKPCAFSTFRDGRRV
jgi:hypothetical protein